MSITFDSKFIYIMGISGAYTHEEAKAIAAELLKVVEAAQHSLHSDGFPPSHRDDPFCECSVCMGFVSRKPAAGKA